MVNTEKIGVGPHPLPWPEDDRLDETLLRDGDTRNVIDKYRYWKVDAIKADLDTSRFPFEIAIENWQHDFNIGTIVRNANAFNAAAVHIIGKKHWNKRGAMVTDLYMNVFHHESIDTFRQAMKARSKQIIGVDILEGAVPLEQAPVARNVVFVFGAEGPGLSEEMRNIAEQIVMIRQYGSTRSINVGVASGIVMNHWVSRYAN